MRELEADGVQVFICAAGLAAHLAGAVAAKTIRPVLGIPVTGSALGGWDALLATVQMPPGFPVGTLALDKVGARNAAWLAAQILALHDPELAQRIRDARQKMADQVEEDALNLLNMKKAAPRPPFSCQSLFRTISENTENSLSGLKINLVSP